MVQYNMFEAKTNLSKIAKLLEEGREDYVIIARNGQPLLRVILEKKTDAKNKFLEEEPKRIGLAKGMFTIPDDFDEIDVASDFEGEIFP